MKSITMILLVITVLFEMTGGTNNTVCKAEQYQYGQWIPGANNCGLKAIYDHPLKEESVQPDNQSLPLPWPFANWCWKPTGCISNSFSVEGFCKKLNGRRILMIGDSIQHQFYAALFMQLGTPGQPFCQFDVISGFDPKILGICQTQGGGHLAYIRNDQISTRTKSAWDKHGQIVTDRNFISVADHFDIFVMNKGAHHVDLEEFQGELLITADWLKNYIETQNRSIQLFYRTTPQGHYTASTEIQPVTEPLNKEPDWVKGPDSDPKNIRNKWELFPMYDRLAMQILYEKFGTNITFLKISYMTHLRADGHRCKEYGKSCDQLHYFLPSVVDSWVQVFYNLLI